MRPIKFRAWDKKNKCWYETELKFYGFALFGECTLMCPPRVKDLINLEITQYTGLKDKNGKDAYFGDLEKFATGLFEIRWDSIKGRVFLHSLDKVGTSYFMDAEMIKHGKIIGNIYENGELLEKK